MKTKIIPNLIIHKYELPQWILSSDIAAYHPFTSTIHLRRNRGIKIIADFFHELCHHIFELFNLKKYHIIFDRMYDKIRRYNGR